MRGFRKFFCALRVGIIAFFSVIAAVESAGAAIPAVEKVRVQTHMGFTKVVLETNAPIEPNLFTLDGPDRLVIDLPEIQWRVPRPKGDVDSRLVRSFSFGLFRPGVSRLVLKLSSPTKIIGRTRRRGRQGFVYEIDLADGAPNAASIQTASLQVDSLPKAETVDEETKTEFSKQRFDPETAEFKDLATAIADALKGGLEEKAWEPSVETAALAPADAEPNVPDLAPPSTEGTMAIMGPIPRPKRPLRIVLDPGHGGIDPGTGGHLAVKEKEINLAFALQLAELLSADPHYEVSLTRDTDVSVKLPKRVAFARRKNADLFISIHADWSENADAKGATAYTLSEEASVEALETIANERTALGPVAGVDLAAEREDVARLLVDLARRETQARSLSFAELVMKEVAKETPVLRRSVRRDSFHVLKAPDMPSVLLELGFVSNLEDRTLLESPIWRLRTAGAVKRAVDEWRKVTGTRDFANQ